MEKYLIIMGLVALMGTYNTPSDKKNAETENPFFAYPVLLIIDVSFLLFLHLIHKKAMQTPQERQI